MAGRKSLTWLADARSVIPAGCSTLAKTPTRLLPDRGAICAVEAKGASFTDADGQVWLDCDMAMGTATWGHARPEVEEAVIAQLRRGISFSVADPLELALAQRILNRFGTYESVKFAKSGADAVTGAVRMARAATGRDLVVATEYHGWHDWAAASHYSASGSELGIPAAVAALTLTSRPGDADQLIDVLRRNSTAVAAVVICPNRWPPEAVAEVVREARSRGVLVIFDEVTSGMRMGRRATCGEIDIWPDLLCISKGLSNGLPLAAVLGDRRLVMRGESIRMSNAHSSESVALAAAMACEDLLDAAPVWPSWRTPASKMIDRLRSLISELELTERAQLLGDYSSFALSTPGVDNFWDDPLRAHVLATLADAEIFTKGYFVLSDQHTDAQLDQIEQALALALRTC